MFLSFFYNCALLIYALFVAPKIIFDYLIKGKYRDSFFQKLGFGVPTIDKEDRFLIWVHAVSMGETKAVTSLVRSLKKEYSNPLIIVSSMTETGHIEAKKVLSCADYHLYLPFDLSWIIRPIISRIAPDLVILSESDFWYNFLDSAKKRGAKIALVNGKMSKKSAFRYSLVKSFSKRLFSLFDVLCIQSDHYLSRFQSVGVEDDKIVITGNLKLDDEYPHVPKDELTPWKGKLGIDPSDKVVVIGSTHAPEERRLLEKFESIWVKYPNLKVVLVPRHPERFDSVAAILEGMNVPFVRLSTIHKKQGDEKVILIDAMGLLRQCYQFADLAIVAGSFTDKVGGHNIVEPCYYGVPVLFGPHMETQPDLLKLVKTFEAGLQVKEEEVAAKVAALLGDDVQRIKLGQAGLTLVNNAQGATGRTLEALCHL